MKIFYALSAVLLCQLMQASHPEPCEIALKAPQGMAPAVSSNVEVIPASVAHANTAASDFEQKKKFKEAVLWIQEREAMKKLSEQLEECKEQALIESRIVEYAKIAKKKAPEANESTLTQYTHELACAAISDKYSPLYAKATGKYPSLSLIKSGEIYKPNQVEVIVRNATLPHIDAAFEKYKKGELPDCIQQ